MSLLPVISHANADTPCWLSVDGGAITGNLLVDGNLQVTGTADLGEVVVPESALGTGGLQCVDGTLNPQTRIQHMPAPASRTLVSSDDPVVFSKVGASNGNTVLTTSVFGANADTLQVLGTVNTINLNADKVTFLGAVLPDPAGIVGTGSIALGATNVVINTTAVTASSKIFLSHIGPSAAGPGSGVAQGGLTYDPADIVPGTSFKVELVDPTTGIALPAATTTADFIWFIIG